MNNSRHRPVRNKRRRVAAFSLRPAAILARAAALAVGCFLGKASSAEVSDPLLELMLKKGMITQQEALKVQAEADSMRTNNIPAPTTESKWKISNAFKKVELFGDIRMRYEDRQAADPAGGEIDLQRLRYSVRVGLRGQVFDDFYFGFRLDPSANPRSAWLTLGTSSSSSSTYQGPFGKSTASLNIGQVYLGWRPADWADITLGKMPNPLYTTSMVWDGDLNPEGAAEHFKHAVGEAEFFANFGQFIYQDLNPNSASGGLGINGLSGQNTDNIFQFAYQGGFNYRFSTNTSAKVAATLYQYSGMRRSSIASGNTTSPYFGDPFVGEGAYLGPGSGTHNGFSGYGTSSSLPGYGSVGYPNNQVGLNHLLVLEVPFEINFNIRQLNARVFGDFAYNLEGSKRARDAAGGYNAFLANQATPPTISGFLPQTHDVKAYQIGLALASQDNLGMVSGKAAHKHGWEVCTYWQHVEQYALDPNLLDSDFMEGRANLEGIYVGLAYGLTENVVSTFRYGYATRINDQLGTGGSNQDIPQINPIHRFNLMQFDLTMKF